MRLVSPPRNASVLALTLLLGAAQATRAQTPAQRPRAAPNMTPLRRLEREINRLAGLAGGRVGVAALHLESGQHVALNGDEPFPMASTYKVPIAVRVLARVDKGEVGLHDPVPVSQSDIRSKGGPLFEMYRPGLSVSVRDLLDMTLTVSDNNASDILLRLAGGPEAVTAAMKSLGIDGMSVHRSAIRMGADSSGVAREVAEHEWTLELFHGLVDAVPAAERQAAEMRFASDPRDTATPRAMVKLLAGIHRRAALSPQSSELLTQIMERCKTGDARLKGLLPRGTPVAHKTGSIGMTTNDVGLLTLPDGAGHVAVAVFVKASRREPAARERAIAEIARAVHDFFVFQPAAPSPPARRVRRDNPR